MKITEVRIFPTESKDGKLKAFATMTFDDWFVVRNVKIIQGNSGLFVAMPSRKAMVSCPKCRFKNAIGSKYCNQCGSEMGHSNVAESGDMAGGEAHGEKQAGHMDIAHPITQECREYIQEQILNAYKKEGESPSPRREEHRARASETSNSKPAGRGPSRGTSPGYNHPVDYADFGDSRDKDIEL